MNVQPAVAKKIGWAGVVGSAQRQMAVEDAFHFTAFVGQFLREGGEVDVTQTGGALKSGAVPLPFYGKVSLDVASFIETCQDVGHFYRAKVVIDVALDRVRGEALPVEALA